MIEKYLDIAKKKNEIKSDSDLARKIGVTRAAINNWRNEKPMSQEVILKLAKLCGEKPEKLLAEYELSRPHTPEVKSMWERIAGHAAIWLIIATGAMSASALMTYSNEVVHNNIYIMLNLLG